ncbi:hypothetical protein GHT09_006647 [Marmota monax]|uniref:G-protein coupled receptors family 1 profile domain-containing protein n=1 Tax=Marmota monax TaxID=9995 RepID=A0A834V575_MARMO|nr:hypothetical protein GHT09_006647 [Marmota monax]
MVTNIESQNLTSVSEFQLMELSEDPELQPVLVGLFLSMYLVTVLGNLLIILIISSDPHLHTPMYFFLSNLSLADIGFISTTVPKMIVNIQTHSRVISYVGCVTQMSLFILSGCMDDMLLTVMAYDRFVAICHPLHYSVIMNPRLCGFLVLMSFLISFFDSQLHNLIVLNFPYFKDVEIANFFCDPSQLLHLGCSDTLTNNIVMCPNKTEQENITRVSEFHLLSLSEDPDLQPLLFGLFLSMYLVTVLGNLLIILAVSSDSHLHTPMYFFLSNLSLDDTGFISTTVPKMIVDIKLTAESSRMWAA